MRQRDPAPPESVVVLRDVLDQLAVRSVSADLSDLLPDAPAQAAATGRIPLAA